MTNSHMERHKNVMMTELSFFNWTIPLITFSCW